MHHRNVNLIICYFKSSKSGSGICLNDQLHLNKGKAQATVLDFYPALFKIINMCCTRDVQHKLSHFTQKVTQVLTHCPILSFVTLNGKNVFNFENSASEGVI